MQGQLSSQEQESRPAAQTAIPVAFACRHLAFKRFRLNDVLKALYAVSYYGPCVIRRKTN
eukprot:4996251-Amphidinium_carterae.1